MQVGAQGAGRAGQHLGQLPAARLPGPQPQPPRRARPPQCTALPAATAALGGGDRILLSSSLIPVPAQRTRLLREQSTSIASTGEGRTEEEERKR